jgi:hypothetical protein
MKKVGIILALFLISLWVGNSLAQDEVPLLSISWSDEEAAILDSISAIKYILAEVDVDNDGKQEFIVPIDYGVLNGVLTSQIAVFEAVGDNDFQLAWSYIFPGEAGGELTQPAVGDLDGDGNLEIIAIHIQPEGVNPTMPNIYIFECKGDNDYGTAPTVTWDLNNNRRDNIRCAAAADLDNDGKQEVVLTSKDTQPGVVIASVSNFTMPVWTVEYIDETTYDDPDIAAVVICNLDGDAYKEVALTPIVARTQLDLYLVEYDGTTYQKILPPPKHVLGNGSIHALDAADLDGNGRDELYIGAVDPPLLYVVTKPTGDVTAINTTDIYFIGHIERPDYVPDTGWMPGGTLGDADSDGKMSFLASASGAGACGIDDWEYQGVDVTDPANWQYSYIDVEVALGLGTDFFIYGIDFAYDMDGDGRCEFIVARGPGGTPPATAEPAIYVLEDTMITSGISLSVCIPIEFGLSQNYPNPFNPKTTISYQLPKSAMVKLSIYNVACQLVEVLVSDHKNAGYHTVLWDAVNVSSGLYFYRIEAGKFTEVKKCVFIK